MAIKVGNRKFNTYALSFPLVNVNAYNFSTNFNMQDGTYQFNFTWVPIDVEGGSNTGWYFFCTFPNGTIRQGRVSPNAVNWSRSNDVGVLWTTTLSQIGQNDLNKCKMYMLYWIT
jgi:hypothetical protein